jgi:diaminopimelate epimerase
MQPERRLQLSKHEGAGNDFLVLLDPEDQVHLPQAEVRALCHRQLGVGADGLVRGVRGSNGAALRMELSNADGSVAEMSGNGVRCLAQAAVLAGLVSPPTFSVATSAGVRIVEYQEDSPNEMPGRAWASVDMGAVDLGKEHSGALAGWQGREARVGNPHLVLVKDDSSGAEPEGTGWGSRTQGHLAELAAVNLDELGPRLQEGRPEGINVELVVAGPGQDLLSLRVWERGVGETLACGTGSCAAAAVAHSWGLVGRRVTVRNPGGAVEVDVGAKEGDPALLAGPVRKVADVSIDRRWFT